jgi:hypothetical protein
MIAAAGHVFARACPRFVEPQSLEQAKRRTIFRIHDSRDPSYVVFVEQACDELGACLRSIPFAPIRHEDVVADGGDLTGDGGLNPST